MKQLENLVSLSFLWSLMIVSVFIFVFTDSQTVEIYDFLSFSFLRSIFPLNFRIDALSAIVSLMVSILGLSIGLYSRRYLRGEVRYQYFYRNLVVLICSVVCFILSNHLILSLISWLFCSYSLQRLLLFYPGRSKARQAARKKLKISYISDFFLFLSILSIFITFDSFRLENIFSQVEIFPESHRLAVNITAILLVVSAIAMSAQIPFHSWLPKTMETPAVVSALMHAGVINGGGYLLIRLSPLVQHSEIANVILIIVGSLTGVYGALVMATQNTIKQKLAYSTISQMGVMMFLIGMGAYSLALYHLVAHSLYKAHAFLSTGMLVSESKKSLFKWSPCSPLMAIFAVFSGAALLYLGANISEGAFFAIFCYSALLVLSLFHNTLKPKNISILGGVMGTILYFLVLGLGLAFYLFIEGSLSEYLRSTLPEIKSRSEYGMWQLLSCYLAFAFFSFGFWLSIRLQNPTTPRLKRLYFYLWHAD